MPQVITYKDITEDTKVRILEVLVTVIIVLVVYLVARELIGNVGSITDLVESAGIYGPLVLMVLVSLGILFTPIPSFVLIIIAGYLYGTWMGAFYSYISHLIAAIGTYAIVKRLRIRAKSKRYENYRKLVRNNKNILYIFYMIPIVPVSITSIISASSKIEWKEFLQIVFLSFAPTVIFFSYFGNKLNKENLIELSALVLIVMIAAFVTMKILKKKNK